MALRPTPTGAGAGIVATPTPLPGAGNRTRTDSASSAGSDGSAGTSASSAISENSAQRRYFTDTNGAKIEQETLKEEDMLEHLKRCITSQQIEKFYDITKDEVETQLKEIARRLVDIPKKFDLSPEMAFDLAYFALYDLCILIDDSGSMVFYQSEKRVDSLRNALKTITAIYGALVPEGRPINVRYVNESAHDPKKPLPPRTITPPAETFDDETMTVTPEVDQIVDDLVNNIPFNGLSRIGQALQDNVLEDYVYKHTMRAEGKKLRNIGKMERPLQVMVITDGEIDGEDESILPEIIRKVVLASKKNKHILCPKAVVFSFSRVGNHPAARDYLHHLDVHPKVGDYVDANGNVEMGTVLNIKAAKDPLAKKRILKMLIGAMRREYDHLDDKDGEVIEASRDLPVSSEPEDEQFDDDEDEEL